MESKQCPFCNEQIKATAIKCRFCGEFLNINVNEAPEQIGIKKLQPFDFNLAEGVGYASIFLTAMSIKILLKTNTIDSTWENLIDVASSIFEILFLIYFSKYLINFSAIKVRNGIKIINIMIVFASLLTLIMIPFKDNEDVSEILFYALLIPTLIYTFYQIKIGFHLININDDFVGRLKIVGYSYIFFVPLNILVLVLIIFTAADDPYKNIYLGVSDFIAIIPTIVIINMLRFASKYNQIEETTDEI